MPSIEPLIHSIDGRIRELKCQIAVLEDARHALVADGSGPARPRTQEAKRPARRQRSRSAARPNRTKTSAVLLPDAAERMLADSSGLSTAALAERADVDRDQVLTLLRELEAKRRVRRTGQRRATRWHAITDEHGIQERTAELTRRSRRRSN